MLFEGGIKLKQHFKSFVAGIIVGVVGLTTAFAAGSIKTATFNNNQVIYNGQTLSLSQPMVSIVKEGEKNASNYMPVRAVLEAMGYTVDWDGAKNAVIINGSDDAETLDPEMQKAVDAFTKEINDYIITESPEVVQAIEQIKSNEDYEAMKLLFSKLEPATVWVLMAEDYQVWLTDGESLLPEVWEVLSQY